MKGLRLRYGDSHNGGGGGVGGGGLWKRGKLTTIE